MAYSMRISRPSGPLLLMNPPAFEVVGRFDPGEQAADLIEIEGDYQDGSAVLDYRLRRGVMRMQVRVGGANAAQVRSNANALVAAVRQREYTLTYVTNGVGYVWRCHPASISLVRGMDAVDVEANRAVYALAIPRQPLPIEGVI